MGTHLPIPIAKEELINKEEEEITPMGMIGLTIGLLAVLFVGMYFIIRLASIIFGGKG